MMRYFTRHRGASFISTTVQSRRPAGSSSTISIARRDLTSRAAIPDLMSSFMESGAFENIDFIEGSAPSAAPSDDVWAVAGYKASRQRARRRAGETA
jgi:hypothetical protein